MAFSMRQAPNLCTLVCHEAASGTPKSRAGIHQSKPKSPMDVDVDQIRLELSQGFAERVAVAEMARSIARSTSILTDRKLRSASRVSTDPS